MPKVSVIIPNLNNERYIEEAITSAQDQTLKEIEIIIIDDCSTDNSWQILQQIEKKDSRIKLIKNKENLGAGLSRNIGLDAATGEYIKFLDSDDTMDKDVLKTMYDIAITTKKKIVCGYMQTTNADGTIRKYAPFFYKQSSMFDGETITPEDTPDITPFNIVAIGDGLYQSLLFKNIRFPNLKWEDFATIPILKYSVGEIAYIDKAVYNYRQHENNTTSTDLRQKTPRIADIIKCCDILHEKMPIQYQERVDYMELRFVLSKALEIAGWSDCSRIEKEKIISALYRIVEIDIPSPTENATILRRIPLLKKINIAKKNIQDKKFSIEGILKKMHSFKNEPIKLNLEFNNYNILDRIYNDILVCCELLVSSNKSSKSTYQFENEKKQYTREQLEDKLLKKGSEFYRELQISQTYDDRQKEYVLSLLCTAYTYLIPQIDKHLIVPNYRKIKTYLRKEYDSMTKEECMKSINEVVHSREFQTYPMSRMALHCMKTVTPFLLSAFRKFVETINKLKGELDGR